MRDLTNTTQATRDGHVTGPLHWVPERKHWTDDAMSDEWREDGTSLLYPGSGDLVLANRIAPLPAHLATSDTLRPVDPRILAEVRAANLPRLMAVAATVRAELDAKGGNNALR